MLCVGGGFWGLAVRNDRPGDDSESLGAKGRASIRRAGMS